MHKNRPNKDVEKLQNNHIVIRNVILGQKSAHTLSLTDVRVPGSNE